MSKYYLRCKINDARSRQGEIEVAIQDQERKIEKYLSDRHMVEQEVERQYELRRQKRIKINQVRVNAVGRACSTLVQRYHDELYSDAGWTKYKGELDALLDIIVYNIRVARDRIEELQEEYSRLQGSIQGWEREIAEIERREAEERAKAEAEAKAAKLL